MNERMPLQKRGMNESTVNFTISTEYYYCLSYLLNATPRHASSLSRYLRSLIPKTPILTQPNQLT